MSRNNRNSRNSRRRLTLNQKIFYVLSFLIVISMVLGSIAMTLGPGV